MGSLRSRLLLGTAAGITAVLLISGAMLYALLDTTLRTSFDEALASRARSLTALIEQEGGRLEVDLAEARLPELEPSNPEYLGILGALYQAEGLHLRAKKVLQQVKSIAPDYEIPELPL